MEDNVRRKYVKDLLGAAYIKNVCIEAYEEKPFMLLLRATENNLVADTDRDRLSITKQDAKSRVLSIPINKIKKHKIQSLGEHRYDVQFIAAGVKYKILITS